MRKGKYISIGGLLLFLLVGSVFFKTIKPSFAIKAGTYQPTLPTSTFTTNFNNDTINYLQDALTANGQTSQYTHNFTIPSISEDATPIYLLMKNLDVPKKNTEQFEIIQTNPTSITIKGIQYILNHGYNKFNKVNTVFSKADSTSSLYKQRYYVTQIALWLYIYETKDNFTTTYCANGGCDFTTSSSSTSLVSSNEIRTLINKAGNYNNYKYLKYIITLVDNAKTYTGASATSNFDISTNKLNYKIDFDKNIITTDEINPTYTANNFMYYDTVITDPNNYGVYIVDKDGNKINNTNKMTGSFKIIVPLKKDITKMNLASIQVSLFGYFFKDGAYSYRVTNSTNGSLVNTNKTQKYSDILYGDIPYQVDSITLRLYNFEIFSKVDATNQKELPGATLEVTNIDHPEKKETWVSGEIPHYIHLDNGKYKLCETIAPKGFALNTECITFTVDDSKIVSVTMKNEPVVKTEDTGFFKDNKLTIIGISFILAGLMGFLISMKIKRTSN